jgi:outer membrane protein assembly factor BamB
MRFTGKFCGAILMGALSAALAAAATPTLTLTPNVDPPSPAVGTPVVFQVAASNFPDSTAVDIYFDTTEVALAVTSSTGAFSGINVTVPTTAVPGVHWVTGVAQGSTGTAAQASFTVQANWPQSGYSPLHQGRNPYENMIGTTNVGIIDLDWSFATGGAITSAPAVSAGTVYFGSADDNLYAVNATTGAKVWSFKTGAAITDSSPAVSGGIVYIGSTDDYLYAVNTITNPGTQLWKFKTGAAINSSPAVSGGNAYIGSNDDSVYAVNATTGVQVWKFTTGGAVASSPAVIA